jgi:SnoaL-like domain
MTDSKFDRHGATEEIRRIILDYPRLSDTGDLAGVGQLQAGVKMGAAMGQLASEIPDDDLHSASAEEAAQAYAKNVTFYDDGLSHAKHLITNLDIRFSDDGTTAEAQSFFVVLQATDGFPLQFIITGRYVDGFALEDGYWRLRTRREFLDQIGDLTHHLSPEILGEVIA